jgi:t-SNARE complex subunit (syntaxin)
MHELKDMFQDMSALLEMSGENLTSIEQNVDKSTNYVSKGITSLDSANKSQKKKRKQMCCFMIILLVIVMIILSAVLLPGLNNA